MRTLRLCANLASNGLGPSASELPRVTTLTTPQMKKVVNRSEKPNTQEAKISV